ncbi:MAG: PEP-CTERM sorting domain-containing protein [Verrucomicrobia bacterium]|nr:PEP-CTERM sorting domain-containing protein [Verrucomicrobiota bacterium]
MKHAKLLAGILSLLACFPFAAHAQTVTTVTSDLLLGFRASGGTGASLNLQVDLGAVTNYTTGAFSTPGIHAITNLSVNDLSSLTAGYGASWNTRSDLTWGIAAATGATNKTLYATFAETTPGTAFAGTIDVQNQSLRNAAAGKIQGTVTALNGQNQTANSIYSSVLSASDPASWTTNGFADAGAAFSFFDSSTFENSTNITGGSYAVSDLYKLATNGTSTYVGSFALNSAGALFFSTTASSFAATPVPEPSTYAAIAGVLVLGVAAWRRQQKKAAAAAV